MIAESNFDVSKPKLTLDSSAHSDRSSSMDADITESGSDSEQLGSLISPKSSDLTEASTAFSDNQETPRHMTGMTDMASNASSRVTSTVTSPTAGFQRPRQPFQTQGGRPQRRALFPSQLPPDEDQKLPIRPNAEECLFYIHTGWCGYGSGCRYNHPPEKMALHKPKAYNSLGLPLREGVPDCSYFLRMGTCKFASTCKFNHPQYVIDTAIAQQQGGPVSPQQQQPAMMLPQAAMGSYPPPTASMSPQHRPRNSSGNLSATTSPIIGPMTAPSFAMAPPPSPVAAPYGQPYFIYYVPQAAPEPCWQLMTTGRCALGNQCPYVHQM